jgi:hypothetical protein
VVKGSDSQCARLAGPLGLPHHTVSGVTAQENEAARSGVAVMCRWLIRRESSLTFGGARVQFAELSGPRGPIQVYGLVMDAWWIDESQSRQDAVRELLSYVHQAQDTQARSSSAATSTPIPTAMDTALLGTHPVNNTSPSGHYALQSSLRY